MSTPDPIQVVSFKRDLQVVDHTPLAAATGAGPTIALQVYEPNLWAQRPRMPATSPSSTKSPTELDQQLAKLGVRLGYRTAEVTEVLTS